MARSVVRRDNTKSPHPFTLDCAGKLLDLSQPRVMGILNVTPDSFSDGGNFLARKKAVTRALEMVQQGAAVIDVGGESTRPGAQAVSVQEELDRVIPVIEALHQKLLDDPQVVPISIDTSKPEVMRAAVSAGAGMINDIRALRQEGALQVAAAAAVPVCLMHMQGEPRSMQHKPNYQDVVSEIKEFLMQRVVCCQDAGIVRERIIIDPGFGFGKNIGHNLTLMRRLPEFTTIGLPLLVGVSRKSMIGAILNVPVEQRLYGSVALATMACMGGASLIRAHDVAATYEALMMCRAVRGIRNRELGRNEKAVISEGR